jgi:hypothetical protein
VLYSLLHFRLAGICRFMGPIQARLQETNSLCRPRWKYPEKTASSSCWWHLNHLEQHTQSFSGRARRLPGGFRGRMQDVICQLVGFGLVLLYEGRWGWRHIARWSATYWLYYINYVDYISYFNWNELNSKIDIIWYNDINWYNT